MLKIVAARLTFEDKQSAEELPAIVKEEAHAFLWVSRRDALRIRLSKQKASTLLFFACLFEAGSHYVSLSRLKVTMLTRLASNLQKNIFLCSPTPGIESLL